MMVKMETMGTDGSNHKDDIHGSMSTYYDSSINSDNDDYYFTSIFYFNDNNSFFIVTVSITIITFINSPAYHPLILIFDKKNSPTRIYINNRIGNSTDLIRLRTQQAWHKIQNPLESPNSASTTLSSFARRRFRSVAKGGPIPLTSQAALGLKDSFQDIF